MATMKTLGVSLMFGAVAALSACGIPMPDDKSQALARGVYEDVQKGNFQAVIDKGGPDLAGPDMTANLKAVQAILPEGPPKSVKLTGWKGNSTTSGQTMNLTQVYAYADRTVTADTYLVRKTQKDPWKVDGFHVKVSPVGGPAAPAARPVAPPDASKRAA